ncbi:pyridoxal phosphate-dependent aminotransferase [Edwardsiella piscicida]|uniref:MalY/PatB family protein n=1 Tax=Edwardsiella piscicida TaxID=1263550 RepID=UPI0002C04971|nr:MalY/PatB family protein [Edwardsiella piscicida]AGH73056.1 aspartate aminotransferase [Edwardsiella piscicida C07-087]EKS7765364.1 pyridoxal phosphate-dependent aminotransferase [Edwardsiella piscicida]EKS7778742.1 pyridoxal phosphate-dependent aminotransferase [Edwardsiella piscicida]EKS7782162.1 pyridoxal phosphate-dependent aminotransferase [Edwardsiella piscicida]EKS7812246.1 pyridoxal phosphate-dependent aminotransferase [Edwardsiella piscicida]
MEQNTFIEKYFTPRRHTDSVKWDGLQEKFGDDDLLAMWVADMDYRSPDAVTDALLQRVQHGVFGYSQIPEAYFQAFIQWQQQRHRYPVQRAWLRYTPGVVTGLYWLINAFSRPGDAVMVNTPVYYPFLQAIRDCGRTLITSDLINHQGYYSMDFADMAEKIAANRVRLFILCSPHNPVGRVWQEQELAQLLALCEQHNVLVISDEIHQDLVLDGQHQPSATVDDGAFRARILTFAAASKTFNLAGLKNAFLIVEHPALRETFDDYARRVAHTTNGSLLGYYAIAAAYRHGADWLQQVLSIIRSNYDYIDTALRRALPLIQISPLQGTYLMWIDLRAYCSDEALPQLIQQRGRLAVDYGAWFGDAGRGFIRLNIATSPEYIRQAVDNIIMALKSS